MSDPRSAPNTGRVGTGGGPESGGPLGVVREAIAAAGPLSPVIRVQYVRPIDAPPYWEFSSSPVRAMRCWPGTFAVHYEQFVYTGEVIPDGLQVLPILAARGKLIVMYYHKLRGIVLTESTHISECQLVTG